MSKTALKNLLPSIPSLPGVYRMLDETKRAIYIGKAKNLQNRLSQYIGKLSKKNEIMMRLMRDLEYIVTSSEAEALVLEAKMVKALQPKFNILLKDDKAFPYIKLRLDTDFPQLIKYRNKNYKIDDTASLKGKSDISAKSKFFGPFASVRHIDKTMDELQKIFKLRTCSDTYFSTRNRPCIQYEIKKCYAPCVDKISKEEYKKLTSQVLDFFAGNSNLQKTLSDEMQHLSDRMQYEEAAEIRDRIKSLSYIQMKSGTAKGKIDDLDVIALAEKNGEFCIQLFMYRQGTPLGNTPYFPAHTEEASKSDVLESFIMQFYQNKTPPSHILISHEIDNKELVLESVSSIHSACTNAAASNSRIEISLAKSGIKAELMENAIYNSELELSKHLKTTAKNYAMLKQIAEIIDLEEPPNRIEIYDNSHLQGSNAYGAMVVAGKEGFEKKEYRLYSVGKKSTEQYPSFGGDDYEMLREVLRRRLSRIKQEPYRCPDLIIIDGGRGHLSVCKAIMEEFPYNIPFLCMSKGVERNSGREQFHMAGKEVFTLDKKLPVMKYLQILRDEAHNFAITSHRKKRSAEISHSILDDIPDIGPKRKKILLNYFGGGKAVAGASLKELSKIEGISTKTAERIYNHFHGNLQ